MTNASCGAAALTEGWHSRSPAWPFLESCWLGGHLGEHLDLSPFLDRYCTEPWAIIWLEVTCRKLATERQQ